MPEQPLGGHRILVVEDEYFLACDLVRDLTAAGATVAGPVPTVDEAMALLTAVARFDAAVLDINLGGELVYPVTDALAARGVPVVFVTGYNHDAVPAQYAGFPLCEKPLDRDALIVALGRAMAQAP